MRCPPAAGGRVGVQSTLSATAGDGADLIGLREVTDSDFPSRATLVMNSSNSMVDGHHMHVHVLLGAFFGICVTFLLSFFIFCDVCCCWCTCCCHSPCMMHGIQLFACAEGSHGQETYQRWSFRSAEDLRPVSDLEPEVNFRPADQAREQVVVHSSGRRPGPGNRLARGCAVTPSIPPGGS